MYLSTIERSMLKSSSKTFGISPFCSFKFGFLYFEAMLLDSYRFCVMIFDIELSSLSLSLSLYLYSFNIYVPSKIHMLKS